MQADDLLRKLHDYKEIPDSYIRQVCDVIRRAPQHIFQVLTKRAERMAAFFQDYQPPHNTWLGVTVGNRQHGIPRLDWLWQVPAHIRFVSVESRLEDLGRLNLNGIHGVIRGESGPKAQPMQQERVLNLKRQSEEHRSAIFFNQWGGWGSDGTNRAKKLNGMLHGRT